MAALLPIPGISKYFGRFLGNAISAAAGVAIGEAMSPALQPRLQSFKNDQMAANPHVPPDPGTLAAGVAQGQVSPAQAAAWAKQHGYDTPQFNALVDIANVGPPIGLAYEAWRRDLLADEEFSTALKRTGLEDQWRAALEGLRDRLLSSEELAMMQQQGFVTEAEANAEAGLQGVTADRQQKRFDIAGLPPGPETGLDMLRRGIIDQATFEQIIREGHTKIKYTADYVAMKEHVLPHLNYVEARVRGYIDNAAMYAGGALTGYTPEQMDLLHKTHGRPPSWHQIWIGLQRGGKLLSATADLTAASTGIDPVFWAGLQQSNIQQQWYDIIWAQRWNYPPPFVLRLLTTTDVLTEAETDQVLGWEGYEPSFATKIATAWAGGTGTSATQKKQTLSHLTDEYLSRTLSRAALTTVLTTTLGYTADQAEHEIALAEFNASKAARTRNTKLAEKQFVAVKTSEAQARTQLAGIGWPANVIDNYIAAWNIERGIQVTTLTVAQIAAALKKGVLLASVARPLLADLGEDAQAIETIIATSGADPAT